MFTIAGCWYKIPNLQKKTNPTTDLDYKRPIATKDLMPQKKPKLQKI